MKKAIFLDRDGVINIEKNYLYKIEDFEFIPGVFKTLKNLSKEYLFFIITNQSGISKGYYKEEDLKKLNLWMIKEFEKRDIIISQLEYCPHGHEDNCFCRKPKTAMIEKILKNFDLDLAKSWLIGDKHSDILCAKNAGIKNTIQVRSGHKFKEEASKAKYICDSIADIEDIINSH